MHEIQEHRKRERDYTSLEDQIRCLKKRFELLNQSEVTIPIIVVNWYYSKEKKTS